MDTTNDFEDKNGALSNHPQRKSEKQTEKPTPGSWIKTETTPPSPRSRFNFSSNRLAAPAPTSVPIPERLPSKPKSTKRGSTAHLKQIFGRGKELVSQERSPLVFNVAQLMQDTEGSTREYDVEADELVLIAEDNQVARNIEGHVRFTKIRNEILAQGSFEADVNMSCVRCLEEFSDLVEIELQEEYEPSIEVATGLPVTLEDLEDEEKLKINPNHMLNLGEALRQQFLVSLPMQPICRLDCPGLYDYVERANADVPEAEAEPAADTPIDKRWAALSQLLDN